jgi:hypothetical protein
VWLCLASSLAQHEIDRVFGNPPKLSLVAESAFEHGEPARHGGDVQGGDLGVSVELASGGALGQGLLDETDDARHQIGKSLARVLIAELLGENPGIRPEDVFVNVLDAAKENWSVGHGLAQFA